MIDFVKYLFLVFGGVGDDNIVVYRYDFFFSWGVFSFLCVCFFFWK